MGYFLNVSFDSPILFIWALCVGFNIALIISFIVRRTTGEFVSSLFENEAKDEESAKTLDELGCNNRLLRSFLKDGKPLRRVVTVVSEDDKLPTVKNEKGSEVADFASAKFYIKEENEHRASSYKKGKLKAGWLPVFTILSVILAQLVIDLLPIFINW